jgi:diacylglycerol kinase (ATP)
LQKNYKIIIIWNKKSGTSHRAEPLNEYIKDRSDVVSLYLDDANGPKELLSNAVAMNATHIVAAGGDGTINAVAAEMIRRKSKLPLGIIPLGSGNDFARSVNMPTDALEAFKAIEEGTPISIDAVQVQSEHETDYFVNVATGGLSTRISKENKGWFKKILGVFSYLVKAISVMFGRDRFKLHLKIDGKELNLKAANVVVANGRYCGGGAEVAPLACLHSGMMDLIVVKDYSPLDLIRLSAKFASGDHIDDQQVFYCRAKEIQVYSKPNFKFSTDGEVKHRTPLRFQVIANAIAVLVSKGRA